MIKGQTFYSWIKVYSRTTDLPVTGLTDGDFTKTLILNNALASETVTVSEVDAANRPGLYVVSFTPDSAGYYRAEIEIDIALYVPSEFKIEEESYDPGAVAVLPTTSLTGTLATLVTSLRLITRDVTGTDAEKLWSDAEWVEYLNDAEREICRRARVISDYATASICQITMVTDQASYSLSPKVLFIERAFLNDGTTQHELDKRTKEWLDENRQGWQGYSSTLPTDYIEEPDKIIFTPPPSSTYNGDIVTLTVKRLPLNDLSESNTTPEIASRYYEDMKLWALYRAYNKDDSQILENDPQAPNRANRYYALFEASVGRKPDANIERIAKEQPSGIRFMPRR